MTFTETLDDPRLEAIARQLLEWPGPALASHRSAAQFFHKLAFLADCGLRLDSSVPAARVLAAVVDRVLAGIGPDGLPALPMAISAAHGGDGSEKAAWALCDAPVTLRALIAVGCDDPRVAAGVGILAGLDPDGPAAGPGGFGCRTAPALNGWRGPGRAADPCPYATLAMLRLLEAAGPAWTPRAEAAGRCLLGLWEASRERHPYIFYMGTDFRKLKLPFVWYDILHLAEALSRLPGCRADPRFGEILDAIRAKRRPEGYVPESVYQEWRGWDFGQKKQASPSLERVVAAIEARCLGKNSLQSGVPERPDKI